MSLARVVSSCGSTFLARSQYLGVRIMSNQMSTSSHLRQELRVENLLIIGSGLMGSGIAQSSAVSGKFKSIVLQDVNEKALDVAKARMTESLLRVKKKNRKCCCLRVHDLGLNCMSLKRFLFLPALHS